MKYIIGIDQSTQGTKAILTDEAGKIVGRADKKHRQIVNEQGWISHDLEEIYQNVIAVVKEVLTSCKVSPKDVEALGISNQRETTAAWNVNGTPLGKAVVWQCARAKDIVERFQGQAKEIQEKTGIPLSPFFPAAKMTWLIENQLPKYGIVNLALKDENTNQSQDSGFHKATVDYRLGTIDAYLVYRLTQGEVFQTDLSNASRTQLFCLHTLKWDEELCRLFGVPMEALPKVCDSNGTFGVTTLEGYFDSPVPICSVMGDSHAALFAHGCHQRGMVKTTYGTGSSIMMNIGDTYIRSSHGLATSLAWGMDGKASYVLEGNINYAGAVITWLLEEMRLIASPDDVEPAIAKANPMDTTVLVPAFTGLSAPHWDNEARALLYGMGRTTGRAEIIKAATESIAYQITDVLKAMEADSKIPIQEIWVDGGSTRNKYLMQFQSDIGGINVQVPEVEEFSALGVAYMAGIKRGMYQMEQLFANREAVVYTGHMEPKERQQRYKRWQKAVALCKNKE